jgi:hypothetical protein
MTVSTFEPLDSQTQTLSDYFPAIDGDMAVVARLGAAFAPHETAAPSLSIAVDSGATFDGTTVTEVAAQMTAPLTVPSTDPRIDRVVVDQATGAASVIQGVEAASPVAPAIPAGSLPVAQVLLTPSTTAITNAMITDERVAAGTNATGGSLINVQRFAANGTYTPTPGTTSIIVELVGGGGSGGGSGAPAAGQGAAAGGGSAGAFARTRLTSGFSGVAVTVGSGGAGTSAGSVTGNNGTASSFGSLASAPGGLGGSAGPDIGAPALFGGAGTSGAPTGGNLVSAVGRSGGLGLILTPTIVAGGEGGSSAYGGGAGGSGNVAGLSATTPGGGGGGASGIAASPARSGGAGAAGLVTVYEFA